VVEEKKLPVYRKILKTKIGVLFSAKAMEFLHISSVSVG
jgi:hypothetical protein